MTGLEPRCRAGSAPRGAKTGGGQSPEAQPAGQSRTRHPHQVARQTITSYHQKQPLEGQHPLRAGRRQHTRSSRNQPAPSRAATPPPARRRSAPPQTNVESPREQLRAAQLRRRRGGSRSQGSVNSSVRTSARTCSRTDGTANAPQKRSQRRDSAGRQAGSRSMQQQDAEQKHTICTRGPPPGMQAGRRRRSLASSTVVRRPVPRIAYTPDGRSAGSLSTQ